MAGLRLMQRLTFRLLIGGIILIAALVCFSRAAEGRRRRRWHLAPVESPTVLLDRLDLTVPADPQVLQHIRRALRRLAHDVGLGQDRSEGLVVAVGEAVGNAIEHAYGGAGGTIHLRARREEAALVVEVEDHGRWKRPVSAQDRGRGLELMRTLVDHMNLNGTPQGTTVRLTMALPRVA